jgi:hypothetical protein
MQCFWERFFVTFSINHAGKKKMAVKTKNGGQFFAKNGGQMAKS